MRATLPLLSPKVVRLWSLALFLSMFNMQPTTTAATAQTRSAADEKKASGSSKSFSPTEKVSTDADLLKQIEQRLKDNREFLKKYYAPRDRVQTAAADALLLRAMKERHSNGTSKLEMDVARQATQLLPQADQQVRELYASSAEEIFLKSGMDVRVRAIGKEKKELRLVYALMSQPLVYKFQNEVKLDTQAKKFGFSKLIYTNGFESSLGKTWIVELK
jgi:hypothetical protein